MFTQNDFKILKAIISEKDNTKGIVPYNGTTKSEIIESTGLSKPKVYSTIIRFQNEGYIMQGLKVKNAQSFILTEKGLKELMLSKGEDINE